MTADARYRQAIQSFQEEYSKSELVNLRSHCRRHNLNYKSLLRWMYMYPKQPKWVYERMNVYPKHRFWVHII